MDSAQENCYTSLPLVCIANKNEMSFLQETNWEMQRTANLNNLFSSNVNKL